MSLEQAEAILKALRESTIGETPLTPGFLDRDITTQNPEVSQLGSTYDVVKRAQQGTGRDFRGRGGEIGGKIYMDSSRENFLPYRKDAIMGISDPSYAETFTQEAPYWAAVGIGSLYTGGLLGEVGTLGASAIGAPALASQVIHTGSFLLGAGGGAYTTMGGLDAAGLTPDPYGQLINPGASTAAQTAASLSTFVPGLPPGGLTAKHVAGASVFGGVVGGMELAGAGINAAMGNEKRDATQVVADSALHALEGTAFGLFMRPTKIGSAAIHAGVQTAHYKNALPSMVAEHVFGGGLFKDGFVNTLTGNTTPSNLNVTANNSPVVRNNAYGRGDVAVGPDGRLVALEPFDLAAAQTGSVAVAGNQSSQNSAKPSSTGRGDITSFDPKTGSGIRVMVMPDGNTRYTLFTNLGGEALKLKGPYKDLPSVVEFNEYDMARMRFDEKWGAAAAEEAARAKAEQDTTFDFPGQNGPVRAGPGRRAAPVSPPVAPVAPAEPPATPAEAVAGATKPPAAPTPVAPVAPVEPAVTPAEAVVTPPPPKPTPVPLSPIQQAYERTQQEERDAGEEQRLADAQEKAAEAAVSIDSNPITQQALANARKRSAEALVRLEKAQVEAEKASLEKDRDSENVEPRPEYTIKDEKKYFEWNKKYGSTHNTSGKKFTPEEKLSKEKSEKLWEIRQKFEKENGLEAKAEDYTDNDLSVGSRRIIPRDQVPPELREEWDLSYASRYTADGYSKKYPAAPKPPIETPAEPPVETPVTSEPAIQGVEGVEIIPSQPTKEGRATSQIRVEYIGMSGQIETKVVSEAAGEHETQLTQEDVRSGHLRRLKEIAQSDIAEITGKINRLNEHLKTETNQEKLEYIKERLRVAKINLEHTRLMASRYEKAIAADKAQKDKRISDELDAEIASAKDKAEKEKARIDAFNKDVAEKKRLAAEAAKLPPEPEQNATREELLAGTRPMKEAKQAIVDSLTPDERKTYIAKRQEFLAGNKPPAAGEVVVPATGSEAAAVVAPVKPGTAVDTPTQAADKVETEIERLIDLGDAKTAGAVHRKVISTLTELAEHAKGVTPYEGAKGSKDPRKYVVRIPGDGTFTIPQNEAAVNKLLQAVRSQGPAAWQGIVSKATPKSETPRVKKFSPVIPAQERKLLVEMIRDEERLLENTTRENPEGPDGRTRAEIQQNVDSLREALRNANGPEDKNKASPIPDPQGRKNVLVQSAVVSERDKDTDRLQVVGVDGPGEIARGGMMNPEPLELESPGGPSTESWPGYQIALEQQGSKNVHIIRLPGTKPAGGMAITGFITIKFKKGEGGGVIPVLNTFSPENENYRTPHWQNWKLVEFMPEMVDDRPEMSMMRNPQYSYNLAETGGKEFGEIQNSSEAKKAFIERLFATFEVRVPSDFQRDGKTSGWDGKPTLYFNQSAMIAAENAALAEKTKPTAPTVEMTTTQHWEVEKDRETAAQQTRTPAVTEAPESAKTKAQIQAESKAEGAKRYGASGVRFNIGGPKNPDSFGGEIRGEKGVVVATTPENWNPKDLQLIKDYLSPEAAILRNGGYPKFYFNTHISGEDSNWVSAPVPAPNGNFLVYEVNPMGSGAKGNSYNRTVRLFRRLVNSDGVQVGSMTEVFRGELIGMSTTSVAADGKPKFQVPAIFHAMMAAAQDSLASRLMTEGQVNYSGDVTNPNPLNKRIALSGTIHEDLKVFEENELSIPGLRDKMEVFNGLNGGESVNAAIIGFMGDPNQGTADILSAQLQSNGLMAAADTQSLISQMAAQMGLGDNAFALVSEPHSDELYPVMKSHKIYPTEAQLMLKWIQAGYKRIISELGKHNEDTGEELPDKVPAVLDGKIRYLPKPGPNGEKMPMMIANPLKWNAQVAPWMTRETFQVKDKDGKITFEPQPHQVVGPNAAMSRWFPAGVVSAPRAPGVQPRAILINDAPGTGKTIQMLLAAVLYRDHMKKLIADPASPWYGHKLQPVLIITQNAQIIKNAFQGDANMAKINLNGKFTENGFEPDEYEVLPDGGRILKGESWIDIGTYYSIKPTTEKVLKFEADGKTPLMVDAFVRDEDGKLMMGPDGKTPMPKYDPTKVDKDGNPVRLKEQAFEMITVGPPKKGYGRWGAVMFDESHNMKNEASARSDAGFEIMSQAQHVLLASGTPIDKPTQLGPILGMLLDTPLDLIASELGMNFTSEKRNEKTAKIQRVEGSDVVLERPVLKYANVPWNNPEELDKYFANMFIKLKMLRDRAGKGGAILRRGTKYFGIENIWMDPSDTMHESGRDLLMKMHEWWYEEMSLAAEGGGTTGLNTRTLKGMMLFEMKRAAAQAKAGIPGTMWNPGSEPRGASKLLMDELAEGRKVILTMDTSNEYQLSDTANIRRFRGLKDENGGRLAYESEYVQWSRFLTDRGIRFGIIKGGIDISQREAFIAEYQKNNPDLSVIIMTTQSGGTGLSIDDRHGVGGRTNPKKEYTPEEIGKMKQIAAEEIPGQKIDSGSFPRTMIIVSSPWGGDVFIQAMGRTDRLLSTTPSRIIVLTTGLSEGDDKLIGLVRLKTMAVEAMNSATAKGDSMMGSIIMEAGEEAGGDVALGSTGTRPVTELGGVTATELSAEQKATQKAFYASKSKNIVRRHRAMAEGVAKVNEEKVAEAKRNKSTNREIKRWTEAAELAREYIKYLDDLSAKFLSGEISSTAIITGEKEHTFEAFKERKGAARDEAVEDEDGLVDDNSMSIATPLGESYLPPGQGPQIPISKLSNKGKPSKSRKIIDSIYGVHHTISGGKVTPETLEKMEKTVASIAEPYVKLNSEGKLGDRELRAILRMSSDVAKLIYRYEFLINTNPGNRDYAGQMSFAGRAIMQNVVGQIDGESVTNTAFHEIGHAIWENMPEAEKKLVIDELQMARDQWKQELEDTNPLKSVTFPTVNWIRGEGSEYYEWGSKLVKKPPVPYSKSREHLQSSGQPIQGAPFGPGVHFAGKLVGPQLASRAFEIAGRNAILAGFAKSMPNLSKGTHANIAVGKPGQYNINESGSTPAEKSTRALISLIQLATIRDTERVKKLIGLRENKREVSVVSLKDGKKYDNVPVSIQSLIEWGDAGFGHFAVKPDGTLVFTTKGVMGLATMDGKPFINTNNGQRPWINSPELLKSNQYADLQVLQMEISAKDIYEMFIQGFGRMESSGTAIEEVFRGPEYLGQTHLLASASNSFTEFLSGTAAPKLKHNTYKLANVDEWNAHHAAELFEDFYTAPSSGNLSDLTGLITSSLYVHANSNGLGKTVKGIIAALITGELEPQFTPEGEVNESGTTYHSKMVTRQMTQAQQSGSTSPPSEVDEVMESNSMVPQYGPARRKLESASEGLESMAISIAQGTLDTLDIPEGSDFRKWLEDVRRRKTRTGEPNRVTGFGPGYKFQHLFGTLIGQVEQIAQITKDPFVADLSSRLYPTGINTGINVRASLVEDVYAHTAFWNNRSNSIIERTLGRKISEAKENKIRTIRQNPQSIPGFRDDFAEYILKVHDPEYNQLERLKFELDAIKPDAAGKIVIPKRLSDELKQFKLNFSTIGPRMDELRRLATIDADSYGQPGSKFTNVALGREADAFLGKYMGETGVDKLFMDVGRCMAISKTSPEYATRAQRFDPEVIAAADELSERWAGEYLSWAQTQGDALSEWGSSYVPRIVDGNIVSSYGNASGDDFVLTAAKAIIEDNKFQRVKLPSTLQALVADHTVSVAIVNESMLPHLSRQEVYQKYGDLVDPFGQPLIPLPGWMTQRAKGLFRGASMASSFMGYDVSCANLVKGKDVEDIDENGVATQRTEQTTEAAHISVNLNLYRRELEREARKVAGSLKGAMRIKQFRDEYNSVVRTINDLAESHKRKVLAGPIDPSDAIAIAKKWRFRVDNRASGVQGGGESGYADLVNGQGGSIKRPDSAEMRTMDTEAADRILDRFYIRDPRVFIPSYNQSVTSNLMIKKHIPKGFFEALHKSVISNPNSARFWPELTFLISKIAGVSPTADTSNAFKSIVTLFSSAAFMPATSMLQLTEAMPAGLHTPSSVSSDNQFHKLLGLSIPGTFATADTVKIAFLKSVNATVASLTPLQHGAMLPHADKFMYRLAERSGVIMSTLMDDLPKSSADPRSKLQRYADTMVQRYHQSGSALSTVTNMSRVAVLKQNVLMLETTADDILLRERSTYGSLPSKSAPDTESFVKLLKPHEILMFRNLGVPDYALKPFLLHSISARGITQKDISKIPSHVIDKVLNDLIDGGYEGNESAALYSNALNRLNFLTIQRSIPANQSRLRGLVDRHFGVFPGSVAFFLTNFNSAYGRNVVLPSVRLATGGFTKDGTVRKPGMQEPMQRPGVYATDVAYPLGKSATAVMIPALVTLIAATSTINFLSRQARQSLRADPARMWVDEKSTLDTVFAAIDQAGWTGNLSLPINVTRALRYERETAQIAAGPFFGGLAGVVDYTRTVLSDKNSPNTPTAERALAKNLYDMIIRPMAQVGLQSLAPNSVVGDMFNFSMTQAMAHPGTREAFMRWFAQDAGNQGQRVPPNRGDLQKAFQMGLINRKQLLEGLKRRELYESQSKREKSQRELREAIERRKESKGK